MTPPDPLLDRRTAVVVVLSSLGVLGLGVWRGTWVAGGSDSYGYVSQSRLWLDGRALTSQPLPFDPPWPDAAWSLSPLGYRPTADQRAIVPHLSSGSAV